MAGGGGVACFGSGSEYRRLRDKGRLPEGELDLAQNHASLFGESKVEVAHRAMIRLHGVITEKGRAGGSERGCVNGV